MTDIYEPGAIVLDGCFVVSGRSTIDIQNAIVEFSIFYDLYSTAAQCEVAILESLGMAELLPIVGDESITLQFQTPEYGDKFEDLFISSFQVVSIENKTHTKTQQDVYIIRGTSDNFILNKLSSIHQTFNDMKLVPILKELWKPTRKGSFPVSSQKDLWVDPDIISALGEQKFTFSFPNQRPFDCINFITNELKLGESKPANIMFYESEYQYEFRWADNLFDVNKNPVKEYLDGTKYRFFYGETDTEQEVGQEAIAGQIIQPWQKITELLIDHQFDTNQNMNNGLYHNSVSGLDLICKRYLTKDFIYDDEKNGSGKLKHIDGSPDHIYTNQTSFKEKDDTTNSFSLITHVRFDEKVPYYLQSDYLTYAEKERSLLNNDTDIKNFRTKQEFFHLSVGSKAQSHFLKLIITIPGNSDIKLGDMIECVFGQSTMFEDSEEDFERNWLLDSRYLVTKVRHTYNKTDRNYFTTLEIVKDSFARKPEEYTNRWFTADVGQRRFEE